MYIYIYNIYIYICIFSHANCASISLGPACPSCISATLATWVWISRPNFSTCSSQGGMETKKCLMRFEGRHGRTICSAFFENWSEVESRRGSILNQHSPYHGFNFELDATVPENVRNLYQSHGCLRLRGLWRAFPRMSSAKHHKSNSPDGQWSATDLEDPVMPSR